MNLVFDGFGRDERIPVDRSQWFTPQPIADRMMRWSGLAPIRTVLEPSAGSGNLVHSATRSRRPEGMCEILGSARSNTLVTAYELDPYYVEKLSHRFAGDAGVDVRQGSYLDAPGPEELFDLGLMNPPFEDGLDGVFLAKAMDECQRIIALVRLVALAGKERAEKVWSRCQPDGDWALRGLAVFSERVDFIAGRAIGARKEGESAKADFAVVKLSRRADHERGADVPCFPEWW